MLLLTLRQARDLSIAHTRKCKGQHLSDLIVHPQGAAMYEFGRRVTMVEPAAESRTREPGAGRIWSDLVTLVVAIKFSAAVAAPPLQWVEECLNEREVSGRRAS